MRGRASSNKMKLPKQKGNILLVGMLIGALVLSAFNSVQIVKQDQTVEQSIDAKLGAIQAVADFETSLASEITAAATTMTLVSTSTASGEYLPQGKVYGFKLGGREYVLGTLSAGRQITSMTRGISLLTGTTTGGTAESWGRGTSVEITDAPVLLEIINKVSGTQYFDNLLTYTTNHTIASTSNQLAYAGWVASFANVASTSAYRTILDSANTFSLGNTFSATTTFSQGLTLGYSIDSGSDALDVANKSYVDGVAIAGASDASQTVKGIVEEATVAEINSSSATGGTGAKLFMTPYAFANSNFASTTVTSAIATSSSLSYAAKTLSMTSGDTVMWWAVCQRAAANGSISSSYKTSNDSATTTVFGTGADSGVSSVLGLFTATTTYSVTIEVVPESTCDQGGQFMWQLTPG